MTWQEVIATNTDSAYLDPVQLTWHAKGFNELQLTTIDTKQLQQQQKKN